MITQPFQTQARHKASPRQAKSALPVPQAAGFLGPATVLEVDGSRVRLESPDAYPWATMAMAFTYRPVVGDVVLAIGNVSDWYVIGVIAGRGTTEITAPGDLVFSAPRGRIDFVAKESITLRSRLVELAADSMELTARNVMERFEEAARWVSGVFHLRAKRVATAVEGEYEVHANEITQLAREDVTIDGKTIHLA